MVDTVPLHHKKERETIPNIEPNPIYIEHESAGERWPERKKYPLKYIGTGSENAV
jgi:hypothetical protein